MVWGLWKEDRRDWTDILNKNHNRGANRPPERNKMILTETFSGRFLCVVNTTPERLLEQIEGVNGIELLSSILPDFIEIDPYNKLEHWNLWRWWNVWININQKPDWVDLITERKQRNPRRNLGVFFVSKIIVYRWNSRR